MGAAVATECGVVGGHRGDAVVHARGGDDAVEVGEVVAELALLVIHGARVVDHPHDVGPVVALLHEVVVEPRVHEAGPVLGALGVGVLGVVAGDVEHPFVGHDILGDERDLYQRVLSRGQLHAGVQLVGEQCHGGERGRGDEREVGDGQRIGPHAADVDVGGLHTPHAVRAEVPFGRVDLDRRSQPGAVHLHLGVRDLRIGVPDVQDAVVLAVTEGGEVDDHGDLVTRGHHVAVLIGDQHKILRRLHLEMGDLQIDRSGAGDRDLLEQLRTCLHQAEVDQLGIPLDGRHLRLGCDMQLLIAARGPQEQHSGEY